VESTVLANVDGAIGADCGAVRAAAGRREERLLTTGRDPGETTSGDFDDKDVAIRQFERAFGEAQARCDNAEVQGDLLTGTGRILPELAALYDAVASCQRCPGMGCPPVLSPANGPGDTRILLVGEAPGRLGAGRTGVPFSGDASGDRFERLLDAAGLSRGEVFVTNAALCLPLDARGRNRPPRPSEIANCTPWLRATVATLQPSLVVAMGAVALRALSRIESHPLTLSAAGQAPVAWNGRYLAATYHPAARAQIHRPLSAQVEDWRHLGAWIRANLGG